MAHVVPLEHKQIAYVSYDPEERSLVVAYHRGASIRHLSIDWEQFQRVLDASNKVDELIKLLPRISAEPRRIGSQ
ncbi:KTSC domain-containing protein [Paenibacillus antri]|uniref:KTSC domain-containing protein n=1 Tax=Paenibacillus antri TaxID=2582848 RepID=A0A5R9GDH8_9BACL|nr:KTSC domain-containing protein [Paenibacillus antri]TLS51418.1 KTSC domain-containing protein [Paenibacillus antri]